MNVLKLLRGCSLVFAFLLTTLYSIAQSFPVSGKITDASGQPLAGVTVQVKGSSTTAITNSDGSFQINAPSANTTLVLTYVGFVEQQVPVNNQATLSVSMTPLANALQDVVVVG